MKQYSVLAKYYDILNSGVDYTAWCDFICERFLAGGISEKSTILDLACGTGKFTNMLSARGYDMIGIDISSEMLSEALFNAQKADVKPLYICQDMKLLDLYGTVDGAICCLDSLNYLASASELQCVFERLHNFINDGGIFIFDINTKHKFETVYGENSYVFEEKGLHCSWQNFYNTKSKFCDFILTFFEKNKDGTYSRSDEYQRERYFPTRTVCTALTRAGFTVEAIVSDFLMTPADENADRHYYITKKA